MGKTEYLEQAKELEKPPFSTVRSPTNTKLPAITCTQRTMWKPIQTLCLPLQSQRALVTLASFGGPCSSGVPHPPYLLQFSPSSARIPSLQGEGSDGELQFRLSLHTISPWVSALPPVQCLSDKDKIRHGSRSRAEYHLKIISLIFFFTSCVWQLWQQGPIAENNIHITHWTWKIYLVGAQSFYSNILNSLAWKVICRLWKEKPWHKLSQKLQYSQSVLPAR